MFLLYTVSFVFLGVSVFNLDTGVLVIFFSVSVVFLAFFIGVMGFGFTLVLGADDIDFFGICVLRILLSVSLFRFPITESLMGLVKTTGLRGNKLAFNNLSI